MDCSVAMCYLDCGGSALNPDVRSSTYPNLHGAVPIFVTPMLACFMPVDSLFKFGHQVFRGLESVVACLVSPNLADTTHRALI
jgi:hypothetical protein